MKNEARLKLFWRGYVCISSRGPLPPLDLELYSRASQANAANRKQRIEVGDYVTDVNGSKDFNAIVRWAQKKLLLWGLPHQLSRDPTKFRGLVLGCIEAKFCK